MTAIKICNGLWLIRGKKKKLAWDPNIDNYLARDIWHLINREPSRRDKKHSRAGDGL